MKKRVVVAMSGGVDSSTVAAILKDQGYDCIGMHLHFWTDPEAPEGEVAGNKCCTLQGLEDARYVAGKLGIPFYVMNVEREFKEHVVDYFTATYAKGETPNPCVECNRHIKFGELLKRAAELGASFLATGHYAKVARNEETGLRELWMAQDKAKDQSYFLYHLTQEKLAHALFPLGDMLKSEVYERAQSYGLMRVVEKPESQGLCFFSESKPKYFLKRTLDPALFAPGPIVTVDGRRVGTHQGLPLYTIGQRGGIGVGGISGDTIGEPWYVVRIDATRNELIIGREKDILSQTLACSGVEWISGAPPKGPYRVSARIRHRAPLASGMLTIGGDGGRRSDYGVLAFESPVRGIAPGQAVVFYEGERVLGGALIEGTSISLNHEKKASAKGKRTLSLTY